MNLLVFIGDCIVKIGDFLWDLLDLDPIHEENNKIYIEMEVDGKPLKTILEIDLQ